MANSAPTAFKNVCPLDCPDTCSMRVTVQDGVAIDLKGDAEHAFTRGFLCQKMARYLDRVYSPDRLMFPMKRVGAKGEGKFERISWNEALEAIAARFAAIAASPDGPQAILPHSYYGTMGKLQASSLDRRFFHRLGASKLDRTICATAGSLGYEYTMGRGRLGADPLAVTRCKFIVNWGSNTVNTNSHLWSLMVEARKTNGATIVTVDPYRSPTASRSDWHIAARPGTDAALALGLMHVIWREGLQDEDYLSRATIGNELGEALVGDLPGPPVRALYVYNSNPATVTPNQQEVLAGLKRDDLFTVVHELFATDTVDHADIELPATSQLEHVDLHGSYGHHEVMYNPRTIAPRGECRSNNDVFRALAARMGFEPDLFPDDTTLMREALDGGPTLAGITLERLQEEGSVRLNLPPDHAPFADGVFPTPSGKCELYSEWVKADGLDPLPTYIPPLEDPQTRPARAAKYPLQLLSPPRPQFLNSTFANSPKHRAAAGEPTIELATFDAQTRGLSDGQWAHVFNDRGSFQARVSLTGSVRPGVAVATGIYWNKLSPGRSNVNSTTSSALTDMGGGATFFDNLVEIQSLSATLDD